MDSPEAENKDSADTGLSPNTSAQSTTRKEPPSRSSMWPLPSISVTRHPAGKLRSSLLPRSKLNIIRNLQESCHHRPMNVAFPTALRLLAGVPRVVSRRVARFVSAGSSRMRLGQRLHTMKCSRGRSLRRIMVTPFHLRASPTPTVYPHHHPNLMI